VAPGMREHHPVKIVSGIAAAVILFDAVDLETFW